MGGLSLAEVIRLAIDARLAEVRVSMPAEIVDFDAATQTASVRPALADAVFVEGGAREVVTLPVISKVPVQFPGGGGFSITFPVRAGDPCLLVFSDRALDPWFARGGQVDPADDRNHALSDAVALLGVRPKPGALGSVDTTYLSLGREGGAADFVALAQKVRDEIAALRTAFLAHGHNVVTAGSPAAQSGTTGKACLPALDIPTPVPPLLPATDLTCPPVASVASEAVKVRG